MTFWDMAMAWPFWAKIIVVLICGTWMFEMFLFPFKSNILRHKLKELIELQKEMNKEIQKKSQEQEKTNVLLSTVMASMLKREQEKEWEKKKESK